MTKTLQREQSLQLNYVNKMLLKERNENNKLKKSISQKDKIIERLSRCLKICRTNLKDITIDMEDKNNIDNYLSNVKDIDSLKESDPKRQESMTVSLSTEKKEADSAKFGDIIPDNVDDLVEFVNKLIEDGTVEQDFLKKVGICNEDTLEKMDNIDVNELPSLSDIGINIFSEDHANDPVTETMSSSFEILWITILLKMG